MNKELNVSYDILNSVYLKGAYSSIELNRLLLSLDSGVNHNLITKIVYGVMEKDILLDYVLQHYIKPNTSDKLVVLLKMATYVHKELDSIPDFALVNEVVNISKRIDHHASGFINATLKNIIKGKVSLAPLKTNPIKYLSVKYSYPEWMIEELYKYFDEKFVLEYLAYSGTTLTHIRILTDKISVEDFVRVATEHGIEVKDSLYPYTKYVEYSALLRLKALKGKYIVQGLPSIVTCNVLGVEPSTKVLDVCSAPGGKTAYIAGLDSSIEVTACDLHQHRVELVKTYVKNLGLSNVTCVKADGTKENADFVGQFDYVLCDVPCSNLGLARKKPDVLLNKSKMDVSTLAGVQCKILENAHKYVKSGGTLLYSTCTILPQENEMVVNKFLATHKDMSLVKIDIDGLNLVEKDSTYTFYPHISGTEGFFIGKMVKR